MRSLHAGLRRATVCFLIWVLALPAASTLGAAAQRAATDDAYTFHGSGGAMHTFALQGGRYVLDVYAGFLSVGGTGTSTCSFSAVLNGIEHPLPGGSSTLGAGLVNGFAPYRFIPTLNLPAGHYTLVVSPVTDCDWSVSIGGGGSGRPALGFGDTGIYHTIGGKTAKTTIVETTGKGYTFGFAYNAWGDGFNAPAAALAILQQGRVLHRYTLAPGVADYGQTAFATSLTFPAGSGDRPGSYIARYSLSLGGKTVTRNVPYTVQAVAPGHWTVEQSGTANGLNDIACPSVTRCISPGQNATIVATEDGHTWTARVTPLQGSSFINLNGVACPTVQRCYVVGDQYFILGSADGGATWTLQNGDSTYTSYEQNLISVSCPSASHCYAVGTGGIIVTTVDGGAHWKSLADFGSGKDLAFIRCLSETNCYALGRDGLIKHTTDGGATWQRRTVTTPYLFSASCPTVRTCFAVGEAGTIALTTDGGNSWTTQNNPLAGSQLWVDSVSCTTVLSCHAVGQGGMLLLTSDGGRSWRDQSSPTTTQLNVLACPTASRCYAVGAHGTVIAGA